MRLINSIASCKIFGGPIDDYLNDQIELSFILNSYFVMTL